MKNLNRNRLIGGSILILSSLLFVPAILTPTKHSLANPDFSVNRSNSSNIVADIDAEKKPNTYKQETGLSLESLTAGVDKEVVSSKNNIITKAEDLLPKTDNTKEIIPINLISTDEQPVKQSILATPKKESWIRVGSFTNMENASKLAGELQRKKYSVKIENTKVTGKTYHRVLIGPIVSDSEMQKVLKQIQTEGFQPNIQ